MHKQTTASAQREPKKHLLGKILLVLAVVIIIGLIVLRIYLPTLLKNYVNGVLGKMPDYQGHLHDIDVSLYRGAYRINGLTLLKKTGGIKEPFIASKAIDLSVQWNALFHGRLVGEIELEHPTVNFVNGDTPETQQTSIKKDWTEVVAELFPFKINRFAVSDGTITYRHAGPADTVSVAITQLYGEAKNLSNANHDTDALPSSVDASGLVQKTAPIKINVKLNPFSKEVRFNGNVQLTSLPLKELNGLLRESVGVDAEKGELSIYSEAAATKDGFKGYIKPIAKDVSLISVKKDISNPLALAWESLIAATVEIFTNQRHDQFATEIPFEGKWNKPEPEIFTAIWEVITNAFWKALPAKLDTAETPKRTE